MSVRVDIDMAVACARVPDRERFEAWLTAALEGRQADAELSVRVVDEAESAELNHRYRGRNGPTNVLAFPADLPKEIGVPFLGDLVICKAVVEREAREQGKSVESHWAHMVIHGSLHLLGYDHGTDDEAARMEALEVQILRRLGYADPYETRDAGEPPARPAVR
jgi:probable rRNA maturation factor